MSNETYRNTSKQQSTTPGSEYGSQDGSGTGDGHDGPYASVPAGMKARNQWVVYKLVPRTDGSGKFDKVPYNARTGEYASSTDPQTWSPFEVAVARSVVDDKYAGIGYVFSENDPYSGVDLDDCRDKETGEIAGWAAEFISALAGYSEASPSGKGTHTIVRGSVPSAGHRRKYGDGEVEMYDRGRFFTVTGKALPDGASDLRDNKTAILRLIHDKVWGSDYDAEGGPLPGAEDGVYPSPRCCCVTCKWWS